MHTYILYYVLMFLLCFFCLFFIIQVMELVVKRTTKYSAFCKEQARGMFEFICCGCDGAVLG